MNNRYFSISDGGEMDRTIWSASISGGPAVRFKKFVSELAYEDDDFVLLKSKVPISDYAIVDLPPGIVVSEQFRRVVESVSATGVGFTKAIERSGAYFLSVLGRCDPVRWTSKESARSDFSVGYPFLHSTWDGSDFFISTNGDSGIVCTERIAKLFLSAGLSNVNVSPLETEEFWIDPSSIVD